MSDNSILNGLAFLPSEGSLQFNAVPYLLIRPETIASLQTEMETHMGLHNTGKALYNAGFTGGNLSGTRYREEFNLNAQEAVEFMCTMGTEIGWGAFRLVDLDSSGKRMVVEVDHSPFAKAYGASDSEGVCHLIRGVLGGLVQGLFLHDVNAVESECLALGNTHCRFEVNQAN